MLRVKVCGLTRSQDARLACEFGADAVGFIFYPKSPRFITPDKAGEIASGLPEQITRIGVFVSPEPVQVQAAISAAGLDAVQIHGSDTPELYSALPVQTICALNLPPGSQLRDAETQAAGARAVVFDSHAPGQYGGSGRLSDWQLARELAARLTLILAGGLNPNNIRDAVEQVNPWGVDVNSGVEVAPGIKDEYKLEQFFQQVKDYRGDRDAENPPGFFPA